MLNGQFYIDHPCMLDGGVDVRPVVMLIQWYWLAMNGEALNMLGFEPFLYSQDRHTNAEWAMRPHFGLIGWITFSEHLLTLFVGYTHVMDVRHTSMGFGPYGYRLLVVAMLEDDFVCSSVTDHEYAEHEIYLSVE